MSPRADTMPMDQRKMKMLYHWSTRCRVLGPYLWNTQADSGHVEQLVNVSGSHVSHVLYTLPEAEVQFSSYNKKA